MSVTLRRKPGKKGESLYLDIHHNGVRSYEFLKLRLSPDKTPQAKSFNKDILGLAGKVRALRELNLEYERHGLIPPSGKKRDFFIYQKGFIKTKNYDNQQTYYSSAAKLREYAPKLIFGQINERFCEGFKGFLLKKLSNNTASLYYVIFVSTLNQAVKDKVIVYNPAKNVASIPKRETIKEYLTSNELRKLLETPADNPEVKKLFLFACLTGLRKVDLLRLKWENFQKDSDGWRIAFDQSKRGGANYLPIPEQAMSILGKVKTGRVFGKVPSLWYDLKFWVKDAGIKKKVSIHTARHTYATLVLGQTGNLKLVQNLLGHKSIKTTEVYAKIMDKEKRDAMDRLSAIFNPVEEIVEMLT